MDVLITIARVKRTNHRRVELSLVHDVDQHEWGEEVVAGVQEVPKKILLFLLLAFTFLSL